MPRLHQAGRLCFAIAFEAFGVQHFIYARFVAGLGPPWIQEAPASMFDGIALVVASIRIATTAKTRDVNAAGISSSLPYFCMLLGWRQIFNPGPWTRRARNLAQPSSCSLASHGP
jgi:hypothetical protein